MAPWGETHEELKNEKMTPIPKVEECTIQLFKEMKATIVNKKKIGNLKKIMILEDYVLKLLIEHNNSLLENDGGKTHRLLEKDEGRNYQHIRSW